MGSFLECASNLFPKRFLINFFFPELGGGLSKTTVQQVPDEILLTIGSVHRGTIISFLLSAHWVISIGGWIVSLSVHWVISIQILLVIVSAHWVIFTDGWIISLGHLQLAIGLIHWITSIKSGIAS